jgi:hypothetical protein
MTLEWLVRGLALMVGVLIVRYALLSAVRTFVLPRAGRDVLTRWVFGAVLAVFRLRAERSTSFDKRDRLMAMYAPVSLLVLPASYLVLLITGLALAYMGVGVDSLDHAFKMSGSSVLTLGYEGVTGVAQVIVSFIGAGIGLVMTALVISYLPTMYAAFSKRETMVTMLEMRVDTPPWGPRILRNYFQYVSFDVLCAEWRAWEGWFAELDESHSSLVALAYFRSPQPGRSWITAAGAVMDSCAIQLAALETPRRAEAYLCLVAGIDCMHHVAQALGVPFRAAMYDPNNAQPVLAPDTQISISRQEFEDALDLLAADKVPLKTDRDAAWRVFLTWRAQYDLNLLNLAAGIMAPYAPWVSDRSLPGTRLVSQPLTKAQTTV